LLQREADESKSSAGQARFQCREGACLPKQLMRRHPILYEINTRCWLSELSTKHAATITLANVPASLFQTWEKLGFTHIWLMGVWTSGARSRAEALANPHLHRMYSEALPDWCPEDVAGSPYAIADYHVPPQLGGEAGLKSFRERLQRHGLKLVLDFVPNHLGLDHPWVKDRPELFVQSLVPTGETIQQDTQFGTRWLAHGKDPFFPAWTDTVQLDYRLAATRQAMTDLLLSLAERCDGVRCDMAMLLLSDVFDNTWRHLPPQDHVKAASHRITREVAIAVAAPTEFWAAAVPAVKAARPEFLFLGEIYWGLEPRLQALGFDFTYDKSLYDEIVARNPWAIHHHLAGKLPQFVACSAHFLENHDEARIASVLTLVEHHAAALLILGLPGMRFLHEGQLFGARRRIPVQLTRRFPEPVQLEVEHMYVRLLAGIAASAIGQGEADLLKPQPAWPENPTAQTLIVIQWQQEAREFDLVVVNLASHRSQCFVPLVVRDLSAHNWTMKDLLSSEQYVRDGEDLQRSGLYLDVAAHAAHLFHFQPT
jgi:hypothetical protein